jgi:FKBP-type peptidyl-prolyl cis-trans isomerase
MPILTRIAAVGETPGPGKPAGMLVFDVELVKIIPGKKPIEVPKDVAAPPKNASKTVSGLAYVVLGKGHGKRHPRPSDRVRVHYSGWMTNGKMFDSSVARGEPTSFRLDGVIKGWTEGLQLMVVGEKRRFWIPGELAYGNTPRRPGLPAGMLVFDVELLEISADDE